MARPARTLSIVHRPQLAAQRLLGDRDAELLPQPSHQIDQTPAHHAVDSRDRASLELRLECGSMRVVEPGGLTGRLAVDQPVGTTLVEFHHPVPHDLQPNPADPGRLGARSPVINRGQRQQTARLRSVLGPAGKRAHSGGIEVSPARNRHGEPPSFATSNLTRFPLTSPPYESPTQGLGIRREMIGSPPPRAPATKGTEYEVSLCRSIRPLHNFEPPATDDEIRSAALQFVRKVSGSNRPSKTNEDAFNRAVDQVAE